MVVIVVASQCDGYHHVILRQTPGGQRVRTDTNGEVPNGTRLVVLSEDGAGNVQVCTLDDLEGWAKAGNLRFEEYPGAELGKQWRAMSDKVKSQYQTAAAKDKKRYEREMKSYKPPKDK